MLPHVGFTALPTFASIVYALCTSATYIHGRGIGKYVHEITEYYGRLWGLPSNCLIVACVVVVIYEHICTAQGEYRVIWRRSWSASAALFLINRYSLLAVSILYLATCFAWWPDDYSCDVISRVRLSLHIVLSAVNLAFTAVRLHAINNRKWFWTIIVSAFGIYITLASIILTPTAVVGSNSPTAPGCYGGLEIVVPDPSSDVWYKASLLLRVCGIVQDAVVLGITWYRTAGIGDYKRALSSSNSVVSLLLRDGAMYFLFALGINITGIITLIKGFNNMNIQAHLLNGVVMSRFILNLRVAAERRGEMSRMSTSSLHVTSPAFSSGIIGDFGASVPIVVDLQQDEYEY
ncbi:hypothetical protein C8Q76DRAFT_755493 [Earliella scabrosa]|nr:hypothetical protein C8Q76DRAFT_755493 [Earliella scabrosa]